jgi:hypothetical protein
MQPAPWGCYENLRSIEALRSYRLVGRVVILEPSYSRALYADYDYERVPQWDKQLPFWDFVHQRGVNVVVLNHEILEYPPLRDDPEFAGFVDGKGEREDFVFLPVEGTPIRIAVRRSILPGA